MMLIPEDYSLSWWIFLPILFAGQIFAAFFLTRWFTLGMKYRIRTSESEGSKCFFRVAMALAINLPAFLLWAGACAILLKLRLADEPYWPWIWYPITFLFLFAPTAYLRGHESTYTLYGEQIYYRNDSKKLVDDFATMNQLMLIVFFIVLCFLL